MARRNPYASWVVFTAVVPAVIVAAIGLAARAPVRARSVHEPPAQGAPQPAGAGASLSTETPSAPAIAPPLPPGPAPDLDLVFTDQVIGYIEPCG
ncbi:MAG: hypothetical protein DMF51_02545 [Acidobacteria bacterium]|nr:MAG: hypothetical protein DMF51_02545 [Acidobacteriota bacterium]